MDANSLKLHLIQQILRTENPEVLRTLQQVLDLAASDTSAPGELPFDTSTGPDTPDTQDLQRDIDEVFNPKN